MIPWWGWVIIGFGALWSIVLLAMIVIVLYLASGMTGEHPVWWWARQYTVKQLGRPEECEDPGCWYEREGYECCPADACVLAGQGKGRPVPARE